LQKKASRGDVVVAGTREYAAPMNRNRARKRIAVSSSLGWSHLLALVALLIGVGCDGTGSSRGNSAGSLACPSCNLVLISLDTLRADHVSAYGYPRGTTPLIDRWAEDAIVFERAFATAPKTTESHMSVFTGLYPTVHQVFTVDHPGQARPGQIHRLNDRIPTLPEALKQSGYHTLGFHGGGNVAGKFGFERGFDRYKPVDLTHPRGLARIFRFVNSMALRPDEKFFLFVHSYHVHDPYTPKSLPSRTTAYDGKITHDTNTLREMVRSGQCESVARCFWSLVDTTSAVDVRHLKTLYDAEISELDAAVGALLQQLDKVPGETVVVLMGDHGEEFREHGAFKHNQIYNEILQVPLIIKHPRLREGIRVEARVSLIDLLPTLLEILGIEADLPVQGSSFLPLLATGRTRKEIYAEYPPFGLYTLIAEDKKLILKGAPSLDMNSYEKVELYDLRRDPDEERNLAESDPDSQALFERLVGRLFGVLILRNSIHQADAPVIERLDEETMEQLKALGYLE
jgi:arylsulfatase A-like enzyme